MSCTQRGSMSLHTFLQNIKPSPAFLLAAWLFSTGARSTCTETVYTWERETGLEPATACLEGRRSQNRRQPAIKCLWESIHTFSL
jgi:hypothetical protein